MDDEEDTVARIEKFRPTQFVGREEPLAECLTLLVESHAPQSVLVHGDRWSGKTWLLKRLQATLMERAGGLDNASICPLLDVQSIGTPRAFYASLAAALDAPSPRSPSNVDAGASATTEVVKELARVGRTIVILDGFDAITRNPAFPLDFFTHLRSLAMAEGSRFAWVLSSRRPLRQLCHSSEVQGSPFFNIFSERLLGAFTLDECHRLIRSYELLVDVPLERHADDLVHVAGRFPLFLRMASRYAFEQYRTTGHIDIRGVAQKMRERARPYFEQLWSELTTGEQAVLVTASRDGSLAGHAPGMVRDLVRRGYLEGPALVSGGYAIECVALRDVVLARAGEPRPTAPDPAGMPPVGVQPPARDAPSLTGRPVRIFVSYAHRNRRTFRQIFDFICGIAKPGVELWVDERISAGDVWDDRIREEMARADIALVLVSQEYLTSRYCMEVEAVDFTRSRVDAGLVVVPFLLSPCQIDEHEWLARLQRVPRVGTFADVAGQKAKRDGLLLELLRQLQTVVEDVKARPGHSAEASPS